MENQTVYRNNYDECPLTFALSMIGGKWRLPVIWALSKNGTMRYKDLQKNIQGITNMMLTKSLRDLESFGIVSREQFPEVPPRVEYSLTEHGKSLVPALLSLAAWGERMKAEAGLPAAEARQCF